MESNNRYRSVRGLRYDLGYSQADMGKMLGISAPAYSNWETINDKDLEKIAKVLKVKKISLVVEM